MCLQTSSVAKKSSKRKTFILEIERTNLDRSYGAFATSCRDKELQDFDDRFICVFFVFFDPLFNKYLE